MIAAWLGFFDSLIATALVMVGLVGAYFGIAAPFLAFQLFLFGMVFGVLGLIIGLVGLFRTRRPESRAAHGRAVIACYLGALLTALLVYLAMGSSGYPSINDISTDTDNPPEFVQAVSLPGNQGRKLAYDKVKYAERQHQGYPALEPLPLPLDPDQAFKEVNTMASEMHGWTLTYSDPKSRTIEGVAVTRLFHFRDDFIIQVRPAASGGGSLVEMRSKSRDGVGDVGANYKRIKGFFASLSAAGTPH
ncbi:MAG TPA: DUF1499 domain-containing protein [Candidatus Binataceae bacterium]|jgi:uncharacterized protein (DUF1499 family)|nr:DUF1499 domain-containing protein [Candidatus Binataceae bacterium]